VTHTRTKTRDQRSVSSNDKVKTNRRTDGRYRLLYLPGWYSRWAGKNECRRVARTKTDQTSHLV